MKTQKSECPSEVGHIAEENTNVAVSATFDHHSTATCNQIARLALAGHHVIKGDRGDFTVCKHGLTRYCDDFAELQAFAQKLGVSQ